MTEQHVGFLGGLVIGILFVLVGIFGIISPQRAARVSDSGWPFTKKPVYGPVGKTTPRRARLLGVFFVVVGGFVAVVGAIGLSQ